MISTITRFIERNRGAVARKAMLEVASRAYLRPTVRSVVSGAFSPRHPATWIFMGGCYNSGTTILRELLGSHSLVSSLPREGVRFTSAFPNLEADGWTRMWWKNEHLASMPEESGDALAARAIRDWSPWWKRNAEVFLEKSITHGTRMPWLDRHFRNARFVGVVRNGYCAAEGIRRRARPSGAALEALGADRYPIAMAGQQWVTSNEYLLRDSARLKHFMLVRYEEFAADPVNQIERLFDFLGLENSELLCDNDGKIRLNGRVFTITDMNEDSISRLSPQDIDEINPVIASMMERLGYPLLAGAGR